LNVQLIFLLFLFKLVLLLISVLITALLKVTFLDILTILYNVVLDGVNTANTVLVPILPSGFITGGILFVPLLITVPLVVSNL
jgi:hypothetical protein